MIEEEEFPQTVYQVSYVWKGPKIEHTEDKYEELVHSHMMGTSPKKEIKKVEIDPYEELVMRKINGAEEPQEIDESHMIEQPDQIPEQINNNFEVQNEEPAYEKRAPTKKRAPKKRAASRRSVNSRLFNPDRPSSRLPKQGQQQRERASPRKPKDDGGRYLGSETRASINPKVHVFRPRFFARPEDASPEEREDLHGPFWVYWPANKPIPKKYAELGQLMGL